MAWHRIPRPDMIWPDMMALLRTRPLALVVFRLTERYGLAPSNNIGVIAASGCRLDAVLYHTGPSYPIPHPVKKKSVILKSQSE